MQVYLRGGYCCCCCCRWLVDWLTSQQHASVSHGWIRSISCTCCHTDIEVANLTQSQRRLHYAKRLAGQPLMYPFLSDGYNSTRKQIHGASVNRSQAWRSRGARLTTRPTRWSQGRICLHHSTCCHTDTEVANQDCSLTQSLSLPRLAPGPAAS